MSDHDTLTELMTDVQRRQEELDRKMDRLLAGEKLETLTTKEVCALLKIGSTKLKQLIASGELPMWKLGHERRITRAGLQAFIRHQARNRR